MNFAFRQEKPKWDCGWLAYEQPLTNKSDKAEELEEEVRATFLSFSTSLADTHSLFVITQNESSNWEDSWKLSGVESALEASRDEVRVEINKVFMPGWSDSWQLAASPVEEEEHRKNWSICCSFGQQMRWALVMVVYNN